MPYKTTESRKGWFERVFVSVREGLSFRVCAPCLTIVNEHLSISEIEDCRPKPVNKPFKKNTWMEATKDGSLASLLIMLHLLWGMSLKNIFWKEYIQLFLL